MKRKPVPKVQIALQYLAENPGATRYEAAKHAKLTPASLYKRLKLLDAKEAGRCPHCGQDRPQLDT